MLSLFFSKKRRNDFAYKSIMFANIVIQSPSLSLADIRPACQYTGTFIDIRART